jgi:uncharacterized repeat protein (TIGR03803 family)
MSLTMTEVTSKCLRGGYRVSEICNRRACSTREHTFGNRDRSSTSNSRLSALFMLQNQLLRSAIVRLAVFGLTILMATSAEGASKYRVLHAFTGTPDGGGVLAGVAVDGKSSLYGTTWAGGAYGEGTVFELIPSSGGKWTETILYSFCAKPRCTDGDLPMDGVVLDAAGNLFGAATAVTFELSPDSLSTTWIYRVLCDCGVPSAVDKADNLYGIGGPGRYGDGDVMQMVPSFAADGNWTAKPLYSFCSQRPGCRDGEPPEWGLAWDAKGNLYGTTELGGNGYPACSGSGGCGVGYQMEAVGDGKWTYHVLHRFAAFNNDGQLPYSGVVVDAAGNVYGTTIEGGSTRNNNVCREGCGTVYKLTPQSNGRWKETVLYDFPKFASDGNGPVGGLVLDLAGNIYGTTSAGGDATCQCGVVFKLTPQANGKWKYAVLHRFKGTDGWSPQASLTFDKNYKHLYGTTVEGGKGGYGVVFEITP